MKQKISYSSVVSGLSIAFFVVFVAIFVLFWVFIDKPFDNVFFWILVGLFVVSFCWIFGSIPSSVSADDDYVGEEHPFRTKKFRYSDIKSVQALDSNYSSDGLHFHGRYKNPVLITFKDGRKYIIGSRNPQELVEYINERIS